MARFPWFWRRHPPTMAPMVAAHVAAVAQVSPVMSRQITRTRQAWQLRAEYFTRTLGLVRFANSLLAQTGARCDLQVEKLVDPVRDEWEPVDERLDSVPAMVLNEYRGRDADSPAELIRRQIWHMQGPGECFMVVEAGDGQLDWSIRGPRALQWKSNSVVVMDLPGGSVSDGSARELPLEQVRRLWTPSPEWSALATSPMEGVLNDCERYWALARRIQREAESALTNGLLFTPEYAHRYAPPEPGRPQSDQKQSTLDNDYYRMAETAWSDDDSVAAIAPWSMHYGTTDQARDPMPPAFIYPGKVLDPNGIAYRAEAAEAIARGLDLPLSLAIGQGSSGGTGGTVNHWTGWLLQETFFTSHMAPIMDTVCHSDVTNAFYRPTLRRLIDLGIWQGDPRLYRVGYDPTPVIVHPDRAAQAITLYGMGLLKGLTVIETNGFSSSDSPDEMELEEIVKTLQALHARPREMISPPTGINVEPSGPVSPSTTQQLPPAPALSSLWPYPAELDSWLEDVSV